MDRNGKIFVAGNRGLVGSAIVRCLVQSGYENLVVAPRDELDLCDQKAVHDFFDAHRPDYVFAAAATVGGILANEQYPVQFLYDNLMIEANVIHAAAEFRAKKLLFLGSTCIFPKMAPQPLREEYLLSGPLEPTNEWYAVAKIAGIKLCQAYHQQFGYQFISAIPTNLYGPGDNFDLETSHVLAALIRKFDDAKQRRAESVALWGTGSPRREFMHVDDCASACLCLMQKYEANEPVNVGIGKDISICELADLVRDVVAYEGQIEWDTSKADGTPRKLVDTSRLESLGWRPGVSLSEGIRLTYEWYVNNRGATRRRNFG